MSDVRWALVKNIFILLLSYIYEIFASYREKRICILLSLSTNPRRPEIMLCIAVQMFSPFPCVFKEPKKKDKSQAISKPLGERAPHVAGRKGKVSSQAAWLLGWEQSLPWGWAPLHASFSRPRRSRQALFN